MKKIWLIDKGDGSEPKVTQFGDVERAAKTLAANPGAELFEVAARSRPAALALLNDWRLFAVASKEQLGPAAFGALEERASLVKKVEA